MAAVTQYVGARYVPLLADPAEWDSERNYEPLTIVLHDGASYTSRQFVPSGIDIENEDYWALTGNYNAQVEQYRQEVRAFDGRITAAQDAADAAQATADAVTETVDGITPFDITPTESSQKGVTSDGVFTAIETLSHEVDAAMDEFEGDVNSTISSFQSSVNAQISSLESSTSQSIQQIESDFDEYKTQTDAALADNLETALVGKEHLVIVGDSFTSEVVRSYSWPAQMPSVYTTHNYASSGTGWLRTGSQTTGESNKIFVDQLQEAIDDDSFNHDLTRAVIAVGSYNDFVNGYTATQVREAITTFYNTAKGAFPGAQIIIVIGNNGFGTRSNCDGYGYWLGDVLRGTSTDGFRVPVVNAMYWLWGFAQDTMYNDEGLHPNTTGARFYARYITELLEGTYDPSNTWFYSTLAGSSSGGQSGNLWAMFNPAGEFKMRGQYNFTISEEGDNYVEFSSIGDGRFTQFYGQTCIPLKCFGNSRYLTGSYLNPSNGRFHIMATNSDASGSVYY